jgi:hypothetical protein
MKRITNEKIRAKAKMCCLILSITLFAFPVSNFGQTINLGILTSFEGFTGEGAATNGAASIWQGDVGTNNGSITGFGLPPSFTGTAYSADAVTAQCRFDLFRLFIHLNDLFVDYPATHPPAFGTEVLTPGVYSIPAPGSLGGNLTLDGGGNPNARFVIKFNGAITVAAGTVVNLTGGTQSCNVFYIADGAISVGASSILKGTLFAKVGGIGLGANVLLEGRMLTMSGALVSGAGCTATPPPGTCTIPIFCEDNCNVAPAVDVLGVLSNYALFTKAGAVNNTGISGIDGNIGANSGSVSGFGTSVLIGDIHIANTSTIQANIDIDNAYNSLMALPNTVPSDAGVTPVVLVAHVPAFGSVSPGGETINSGVYFINSAGSLGGTLVLDAQNNPDAIFVFKFAGAFTVTAQAKMILINGARRCNVFFIGGAGVATGAVTIGANAVLKGTFLSHNGACGSGASLFLNGRLLSTGGAVNTYSGIVFNNPVCITSASLGCPNSIEAGPAQGGCVGATYSMAANNPTIGTGAWTWSPSTPTYVGGTSASDYNAQVDFTTEAIYTGTWSVSGSACAALADSVVVSIRSAESSVVLVSSASVTASEVCEESSWTYYANPATPEEYIFAIAKNGNNFMADVVITDVPGTAPIESLGGQPNARGTWLISRYWNVTLSSGSISAPVSIRFFIDETEQTAAWAGAVAFANANTSLLVDVTPLQWFKTNGTPFNPTTNLGNGNFNFSPTYLSSSNNGLMNGVKYYQLDNLTSFSGGTGGYSVNDDMSPLPVELLNFEAQVLNNEYVQLDWSTATEINNDGFEVLRSTDGVKFERIAWVDGNGNSTEINSFNFDDTEVSKGVTYYYQLKQVDFNGESETFNIVTAKLDGGRSFTIGSLVPNPAKEFGTVSIELFSLANENINITIYNHVGVKVKSVVKELHEGDNELVMDIENLSIGVYFINFGGSFGRETKKLIIVN